MVDHGGAAAAEIAGGAGGVARASRTPRPQAAICWGFAVAISSALACSATPSAAPPSARRADRPAAANPWRPQTEEPIPEKFLAAWLAIGCALNAGSPSGAPRAPRPMETLRDLAVAEPELLARYVATVLEPRGFGEFAAFERAYLAAVANKRDGAAGLDQVLLDHLPTCLR